MRKPDRLWVFDAGRHLEVYAPTRWEAEKEAENIGKDTGLTFTLNLKWQKFQEDNS
jgi:hypothetical protein|tara:strand:- start:1424 stop:1591 length:168 start_codon:yes stop_codon:yes gene_type:complete